MAPTSLFGMTDGQMKGRTDGEETSNERNSHKNFKIEKI